ncbi:helix-turn-helix domain-containing protein [Mycolicibacterium sphagni]|nr:helix-turn-helix domain-containing protein [Mycolicibacterium sphagni]
MTNYPEMMTAQQVGEYLQVSSASLAQDRYRGDGIPFVKIGKRVRYRRSDVANYLEDNTFQQTIGHGRLR